MYQPVDGRFYKYIEALRRNKKKGNGKHVKHYEKEELYSHKAT